MKKVIVVIGALLLAASAANAQSWLDSFLKVATEKVGDVVTGGAASSQFDIKGSWKYQGVAIGAASDNILTGLAASAGTASIEKKCDALLAKAGIKAGIATFSFKEDGSFTLNAGKINLPGTWSKDGSKITINFAKLFTLKLVGTIKATSDGCQLLFDADKFLDFIQKVLEAVNKVANSSAITTLQQTVAGINGLQLGFKLSK